MFTSSVSLRGISIDRAPGTYRAAIPVRCLRREDGPCTTRMRALRHMHAARSMLSLLTVDSYAHPSPGGKLYYHLDHKDKFRIGCIARQRIFLQIFEF